MKGAYWDFETVHARATGWPIPVFQQKWQSDANFERITRYLLRNHEHLRTALGSHNIRSLAHGIATAEHLGLPRDAFELQMLYGMADAEKQAIVDAGYRLRIYMPYGELIPGMAYLVRRLLENTSNDSFLRASFSEEIPPEVLLMNPLEQHNDVAAGSKRDESPITVQIDDRVERFPAFRNEPPIDFAIERNRAAMREALGDVKSQLGRSYPLVINGENVETRAEIVSRNPSDISQSVGNVAAAEPQHVLAAVSAGERRGIGLVILGGTAAGGVSARSGGRNAPPAV